MAHYKAAKARILEERRALRYAISLLRDLGIDNHVEALERVSRRLYSEAPTIPKLPSSPVQRLEPADPAQAIFAAMVRVGRESME